MSKSFWGRIKSNPAPFVIFGCLIALWLLSAVVVSVTSCDNPMTGMDAPSPDSSDDVWYCYVAEPVLFAGEFFLVVSFLLALGVLWVRSWWSNPRL